MVTYTSSENGSDTFTYALNIALKSPADGNLRDEGISLAIACQSSTLCEYATGAQTAGYGFISNVTLDDGTAPLSVAIFEDTIGLFYFTTDTDNAVGTDAQGRQVLDGAGFWESSPEQYTSGLVTATRVGNAKTLQQTPTTPGEPTPPGEPEPPTEPTPEPPAITSFTASSRTIESGDDVRLSWNVENADTLSISPDVGTVTGSSVVAKPDETTTYTLTATNEDGSDQASVSVRVREPAPPEPEEPELQYWVRADCGEVSTTYATAGGGTAQRDFGNGVVYESDGFSSGDFVYISAQNQCDSGEVTVRIYKRGSVYRETSSSGAYVIATASGTF